MIFTFNSQIVGHAICSSSSFWWPRFASGDPEDTMYYPEFYFLEEVMHQYTDGRPRQRILIDSGTAESCDLCQVSNPINGKA